MHSLFCSISNNCKSSPTTADDTTEINNSPDHESLIIGFIRWIVEILETFGKDPDGWKVVFRELINLVHMIADLGPSLTPGNDFEKSLNIPVPVLFGGEEEMKRILTQDLQMNENRAELFQNISLTPFFFHQIYLESKKKEDFVDRVFENVDVFCNDALREKSFVDENNEVEKADLCEISYYDLFVIFNSLNSTNFETKILNYFLDFFPESQISKEYKDPEKRASLIKAVSEVLTLPYFDFSPFFGSEDDLIDAIFCGNFLDSMKHQTGGPTRKANEMLQEFQKQVQEFVMKLTPGQTHDDHGIRKCGDIVVNRNPACDALSLFSLGPLNGITTMFSGYILVSPDVPITRELVKKLNEPMKNLSYFHDVIADFHQVSKSLQDAISVSDLEKASDVILRLLPSTENNGTGSLIWALNHLFKNSSDPESLLMIGDQIARQFLNVSGCFRFDRFVLMKNEEELEKQAVCLGNNKLYFSGIVFPDDMTNYTDLTYYTEYKIRHLNQFVDSTDYLLDRISRTISRDDPFNDLKYLTFGFSFLQEAIERSLVSIFTNKSIDSGILVQQEPYPCTLQDTFNVTTFLSLFLILSWMIPSALLVKNIVWEKEMRLKEMMRIMGLGDMIHWLILPQTAVGYGMTMLATAEAAGLARWETIQAIEIEMYQVSLTKVLVAFAFDTVVYLFVAWYISALFPGAYGIPKKWNFFLTKSYWCNTFPETETRIQNPVSLQQDSESEPNLPLAVEILEMEKVYNNHTKALDKLSVKFYESQITAFLGHNGAGKTTTISILTGLYPPSGGTAYVYGKDIRTDISAIRESLGVCPQHNVLFDSMTVEEQLRFYGSLKGLSDEDLEEEVDSMLVDLGLTIKRKSLSSDLSGGMKRKLCIGIALIGGSKLVILDEPTAGIDAHARRSIWQLLLKHKKGRTMILSTHHMDEADVLADRITVIAEGQLKAAGSALFLKKKFGKGYKLTIARSTNRIGNFSHVEIQHDSEKKKNLNNLIENLTKKRANLIEDLGTEVIYNIPLDMSAEELKVLFEEIDKEKFNLEIDSYGISAPSLQQIFIQISPIQESTLKKENKKSILKFLGNLWNKIRKRGTQVSSENLTEQLFHPETSEKDQAHPPVITVNSNFELLKQHSKALFAKRIHNSRRSVLQLFCLLVCPIFLILVAELYAKFQRRSGSLSYDVIEQPLYMTPVIYGNFTEVYFGVWNKSHSTLPYLNSMMESPGIGCRCMTDIDLYNDTMDRCLDGYAQGHMDLSMDIPSKIPYNVDQTCGCTPNSGWNCTFGDYPLVDVQNFTLNTSDKVWDVSYRNISQFRLMTSKNTTFHSHIMLGGWTVGHTNVQTMTAKEITEAKTGIDTLIVSLEDASSKWSLDWENATEGTNWTTSSDPFNPPGLTVTEFFKSIFPYLDTEQNTKIWFNNKAYASLPINTNSYHNGILRAQSPWIDPALIGIMAISHPMNQTVEDAVGASEQLQKTMMFRVVVTVLVMSFIPASVCMVLVEERKSFSKHLQSVFGVSSWLYWVTNFIYDYITLNLCCFAIIIIYCAMGVDVFTYSIDAFYSTLLIFLIYNASVLPCVYALQMIFSIPAVAYALIGIGLFFVGVVTSMTILLLENLVSSDDTLIVAHRICSIVFLVIPQYNLGVAISRLNFIYGVYVTAEQYLEKIGRRDMLSQLPLPRVSRWDLMGIHFFGLILDGLMFLIILILIEYKSVIFKILRKRERMLTRKLLGKYHRDRKLLDEDVQREQNFVENLKGFEDYGLVVQGLSKAYNGEFLAVEDLSFAVEKGECFGLLGVNGAGKTTTFSMLTGRIPIGSGDAFIHGTSMQLRPYANEVSGSYSGGNKRKLSAAIALVADPPVVLLDEPSAGMDVSSQQFMWNLILQLRRTKRTVILTSHSMEECEALCTRTAIMVNGQFRCIGSIQHLKEKFGQGYTLTIKVSKAKDIDQVKEFVKNNIPGAVLQSIHCNSLFYRIRSTLCSLPIAFGAIEELQKITTLEDYSLSQTTLDDVFVSFAARSVEDPSELGDVNFDEIHSPLPEPQDSPIPI
ncbi:hypothetical protein FO519_005605 [Halicephalobus sp. NKZ332]|nr:hypothetical protein FO519_005605 [Halicephalobus sp. NKZ332]